MLNITKEKNGTDLIIKLEGRLDTLTASQLEEELRTSLDGVQKLQLDMNDLQYLSSAGLRVLLVAQKQMNKQGEMCLTGVSDTIMDVFELTGFIDILTIEETKK